ncbi:hypothetical protein Prum_037220 [Phytohabitans rumicis]|uniref:Uncharacterized protein n=1 Tax=Phytohabitans rumicis TaxID=1076125 RepID=A0A6V8L3F2_9ACTN|nr:hypothetical protein Prum_037220 [Phytohabitans rumicis]
MAASAHSGGVVLAVRRIRSSAAMPRPARTGVRPYVVIRVSWLAISSRDLGMRLGTAASLAGIHINVTVSMKNVAMAAQPTVIPAFSEKSATIGIEAKSTKRNRSQMTIVRRRSNRSAITPANGPRMSAGSSRTAITEPKARPFAASPLTCADANVAVASRPSQSPRDATPVTTHNRRNGRIRRTDRSALKPDRSTWADDELADDVPLRPSAPSSRGFASMTVVPPPAGLPITL